LTSPKVMVPVQSARGAMVFSYNERGRQIVALVVDLLGEPKLRYEVGMKLCASRVSSRKSPALPLQYFVPPETTATATLP
jgi:hypothetical protein